MRQFIHAGLIACAAAALTACTGSATRSTPAGPNPSAAASLGARPRPTTAPARPSPVTPSRTNGDGSGAGTGAGRTGADWTGADWTGIDWPRVMHAELACRPGRGPATAEIAVVRYSDLTGDGRTEAVVAASCWTDTSTNPVGVVVFAGQDRRPPLRRLLRFGEPDYLRNPTVSIRGRSLHVTAEALSDETPLCCADLRIELRYRWQDGAFHRTYRRVTPLAD